MHIISTHYQRKTPRNAKLVPSADGSQEPDSAPVSNSIASCARRPSPIVTERLRFLRAVQEITKLLEADDALTLDTSPESSSC